MRIVIEIDDDERCEFVRELDSINHRLIEIASEGTVEETVQIIAFGVGALCRLASDILRPPATEPEVGDGQLLLFPDDKGV